MKVTSKVLKFRMSYKCVVGPLKVNFLSLMMIFAIIPGECKVSFKREIFKRYQNASTDVCSLEKPSHVLNNVRSKIECVFFCQNDPRCSGVNWKKPRTCEMYFFNPSTFGRRAPSCSYYSRGNNYI